MREGHQFPSCTNEQVHMEERENKSVEVLIGFSFARLTVQRQNADEDGDLSSTLPSGICGCPTHLPVMLARAPYCESSGLNINGAQNPTLVLSLFLLSCEYISISG